MDGVNATASPAICAVVLVFVRAVGFDGLVVWTLPVYALDEPALARTKAVVATCVVLVPTEAVGAVGVPVRAGEASLAYDAAATPPSLDESAAVAVAAR